MSEGEVWEKASSVPKLQEFYSNPTVELSVGYEDARDAWRVVLTEETSGDPVAYLTVADDSGEVEGVNFLSSVDDLTHPSLTRDEAVKLALADERVRAVLSEHGPYTTGTEYDDVEVDLPFAVVVLGAGGRQADGRGEGGRRRRGGRRDMAPQLRLDRGSGRLADGTRRGGCLR